MLNFVTKIFDSNDREVKKLLPMVKEVNALEEDSKKLKKSDFPKKTKELKERVKSGENLFLILPEAFALVREASIRSIGLRHFDVQIMAATALAQGKVAEQKTGEGKTLSAIPALYLHALTGKSVHLVTVNDYLARRDAGWMGAIFEYLGMSVSSIINSKSYIYDNDFFDKSATDYRLFHLKDVTRQEAYKADIVYGINSEFGFDYLRDNMAFKIEEIVQRDNYFAVIDEVDSVLIDEARTPHIISMPDTTPSNKYNEYEKVIGRLSSIDFKIDEKMRTAHLTDHGIGKIEKMFGIEDIYEKDFDTVYHIEAALKANTLFAKNKDYIVRENQVILVDEFTGRLMEGRRLSEGLHQAIEAKEGVPIQQESKTLATISLQNYFRMYENLAGMTGTALTEAEEFHKIYKLDVIGVPPNRTIIREDNSDLIYKTRRAKVAAVVKEIEEANSKGQPVLVGTTSIEQNEIISEYLKHKKITHEILNAKNHSREAMVIKDAGKFGAVTVATNMAGRGVDIILGGHQPSKFEVQYQDKKGKERFKKEYDIWKKEHDKVIKAGGLYVIGTEKHESRRIDNQLRGRSGRQGDPGKSVFIVSLEDDLMRIFGGEQIAKLMTRFNFPEDQPLTHSLVTKVITQAQVKVEGFNFEARKQTVDYDDVLNKQREIVYDMRRDLLEEDKDHNEFITERVSGVIENIVNANLNLDLVEDPIKTIIDEFSTIIPFDQNSKDQLVKQLQQKHGTEEVTEFLSSIAFDIHKKRRKDFGDKTMNQAIQIVSLQVINNLWMDHLTTMEDLRVGIGLRGYAQKDPLVEYKNEAFTKFEQLIGAVDDGIVHRIYKISVVKHDHEHDHKHEEEKGKSTTNQPSSEVGDGGVTQRTAVSAVSSSSDAPTQRASSVNTGDGSKNKKIGRNDPCPCGSGLKYKKCGLINSPKHSG